jgi:hypothetical protein
MQSRGLTAPKPWVIVAGTHLMAVAVGWHFTPLIAAIALVYGLVADVATDTNFH